MTTQHRLRRRGLAPLALALVGLGAACVPAYGNGAPTPVKIYDSTPTPVPGNVSSQGFECCQVAEFGDQITFAGTARTLQSATVTMSDWAVQADYPSLTDPTGWNHPLTLNIYAVGPNDINGRATTGSLLGTLTRTFHIPWRPAADPINCPATPTKFQSQPGAVNTNCYNGLANQVTFDLTTLNLTAPSQIVWGVAFNTQSYGAAPIGAPGPFNSLNVGAQGNAPSIGTHANGDAAWIRSTLGYPFCDGIGGPSFRPDTGCAPGNGWTGSTPEISFSAI